jgi:ferrous iron transport protein B
MGFGCNAVGVTGCRIIDSPRERLIAVITNSFVPCNGKFPIIITCASALFVGSSVGISGSLLSALFLTAAIILGIAATLAVSKILSLTILKGLPSSIILELPPYRRPLFGRVIVRAILDRALFVLGRAVIVAAPAGLVIWAFANIDAGGVSLLTHISQTLDPAGKMMGLDGVILLAFILGMPANEIVVPLMIMIYTAQGSLTELNDVSELRALFAENGWTWVTAVCTAMFALIHWPCSTTLLTVKKETGSLKWTAAAFLVPTAVGAGLCVAFAGVAGLLGIQ